jgi:two-component sensor histidine kinase
MIHSITNLSARFHSASVELKESLSGRVATLGRMQVLLGKHAWRDVPMEEVVATALALSDDQRNLDATGCALQLRAEVALALGLALHELMSNSKQFGALSSPQGSVELTWTPILKATEGQHLIEWREFGGPTVKKPTRSGLGLELLKNILPAQLGGATELDFEAGGLAAKIVVTP